MFKKLNNKKLSLVFIVLLVLVLLVLLIDKRKGGRSFTENIAPVDTAVVSKIEIFPGNNLGGVILEKSNGLWKVNKEGKTYSANQAKVNDILLKLSNMKPTGVVSDDKEKWSEFNVTDSAGIHVQVFEKNKKKADFIIGRFNYKPNNNNMYGGSSYNQSASFKTYVRPVKEKKVYTINEFLAMSFNADLNSYRNNILAKLNPDDIVKIRFNYPADSSFILEKDNSAWKINGNVADSMKVINYLNSFRNLTSSGFVDSKPIGAPLYTVIIEGNNVVQPVTISANIMENEKIIVSSENEEAYFDGDQSNLFSRIFTNQKSLIEPKVQ